MNSCLINQNQEQPDVLCLLCRQPGKPVDLLTLQSQLTPAAMPRLDPAQSYSFCRNAHCEIIYFSPADRFLTHEIREKVFQKDPSPNTPVCYCFGYSRARIRAEGQSALDTITRLTKEKRCACEIRNPQGSCCLGNVRQVLSDVTNP